MICSSEIKNLRDSITEGINTYRVSLIRLKDENGDRLLKQLAEKTAGDLTREDIIPLLFSPLMGGRFGQKERILRCIEVLKNAETIFPQNDIRKMEAILYTFAVKFLDDDELKSIKEAVAMTKYTFAVKFLDDDELKSIKEAVAMTKLGQMIWNDALEKGREEGEKIGQERASDRYSRLILLLTKENKNDLIVKIASDPQYREELYKQYGI